LSLYPIEGSGFRLGDAVLFGNQSYVSTHIIASGRRIAITSPVGVTIVCPRYGYVSRATKLKNRPGDIIRTATDVEESSDAVDIRLQ
jgi:ribosomal protein S19E (S16A)